MSSLLPKKKPKEGPTSRSYPDESELLKRLGARARPPAVVRA
jgi:hypothetical protein